jgi:hypothetical protein
LAVLDLRAAVEVERAAHLLVARAVECLAVVGNRHRHRIQGQLPEIGIDPDRYLEKSEECRAQVDESHQIGEVGADQQILQVGRRGECAHQHHAPVDRVVQRAVVCLLELRELVAVQ